MKILKKVSLCLVYVLFSVCLLYFALTIFAPQTSMDLFGFRFYTVLSGSMEPEIPTGSLVVVTKTNVMKLKKEDVITFKTKLNGKDVVITHYFDHFVKKGDKIRIFTHREGTEKLDNIVVYEQDLIGKCVWSVPFVGWFFAYLQSVFGIIALCSVALMCVLMKVFLNEKKKDTNVPTNTNQNALTS